MAAGQGHDLFAFISPCAGFEDEVIDHREIVEEVEAKVGKMTPAVERAVRNRKTGKYFAFPDFWAAYPVNYRVDLWVEVGLRPTTWNDLVRAGTKLKAAGGPLGVGLSPSIDSSLNAFALLFAHGSSVQDEEGNVVLDSPSTVEALRMATAIYREGVTEEIFFWDDVSDNRFLASGKGSLSLDPVSAIRAVEKQDPQLAEKIALAPPPAGPAVRLCPHLGPEGYVIWKFSRNPETAKQFLVDLALGYRDAFLHSEFYNLPGFPRAIPNLADLLAEDAAARPAGKYTVLADAVDWSTNIGHPGDTNAAMADVFNRFVVPNMFVAAARGDMSITEAIKAAVSTITPIFEQWRERGKI